VRGLFLLPGYEDMEGIVAEARRAGVDRVVLLSGSSAGSGDTSNAMSADVDAFFHFYVDGSLDESQVQPAVREILGRDPRTFERWAAAHADAFR
jgi:hypothetical protein